MANSRFNKTSAPTEGVDSAPKIMLGGKPAGAGMALKTVKWPGLPGGKQPVDRSHGTPRARGKYFVSEGI